MIPTTSAILTWMKNASPTPRTWSGIAAEGPLEELADVASRSRSRWSSAIATAMIDRKMPGAQLAEVVDERHDRLVAGRGGRRR